MVHCADARPATSDPSPHARNCVYHEPPSFAADAPDPRHPPTRSDRTPIPLPSRSTAPMSDHLDVSPALAHPLDPHLTTHGFPQTCRSHHVQVGPGSRHRRHTGRVSLLSVLESQRRCFRRAASTRMTSTIHSNVDSCAGMSSENPPLVGAVRAELEGGADINSGTD